MIQTIISCDVCLRDGNPHGGITPVRFESFDGIKGARIQASIAGWHYDGSFPRDICPDHLAPIIGEHVPTERHGLFAGPCVSCSCGWVGPGCFTENMAWGHWYKHKAKRYVEAGGSPAFAILGGPGA